MGLTLSNEDDSVSVSAANANITIDVLLVGKPRSCISQFEPRGLNANAT